MPLCISLSSPVTPDPQDALSLSVSFVWMALDVFLPFINSYIMDLSVSAMMPQRMMYVWCRRQIEYMKY